MVSSTPTPTPTSAAGRRVKGKPGPPVLTRVEPFTDRMKADMLPLGKVMHMVTDLRGVRAPLTKERLRNVATPPPSVTETAQVSGLALQSAYCFPGSGFLWDTGQLRTFWNHRAHTDLKVQSGPQTVRDCQGWYLFSKTGAVFPDRTGRRRKSLFCGG